MIIVGHQKIEDCFDGSAVISYEVSEPWTAQSIRSLASLGELHYYSDFPRPLFRLRSREGLFISGVEGSVTCRVVLPKTRREGIRLQLEEAINNE